MPDQPIPLSILDLSPVTSGGTPAQALRNTLDLAQRAEEAGYLRYWVAEHHLTEGVASSSPAVLIGAIASVTARVRVGSAAVQRRNQTLLAVVGACGMLFGLYPGRIDLGLGRSGQRRKELAAKAAAQTAQGAAPGAAANKPTQARLVNGLLIPPPFSLARLLKSPKLALHASLLQQPGADSQDFGEVVYDIRAFLAGTYKSADGIGAVAVAYREAFRPGVLDRPLVMVSADVVVAPTDAQARELASPYGLWVRSIRTGAGAMPFPSLEEARAFHWSDEDRALVEDRVSTQFVGSPATVAKSLRVLQEATGADELLVTTITHQHAARVRSAQLLAKEWGLR